MLVYIIAIKAGIQNKEKISVGDNVRPLIKLK